MGIVEFVRMWEGREELRVFCVFFVYFIIEIGKLEVFFVYLVKIWIFFLEKCVNVYFVYNFRDFKVIYWFLED